MSAPSALRPLSKLSSVFAPPPACRPLPSRSTCRLFFSSSSAYSTTHAPPPFTRPSRSRSFVTSSLLLSAGIFTGFAASLFPRPKIISLIFPVPTPVAPTPLSPEGITWTTKIEETLQGLAVVKGLREATEGAGELKYKESRPYANSSPGPHSLSASTLRGPGRFSVAPLVFTNNAKTEGVFLMHLGGGLCGHEGVIHGGCTLAGFDVLLMR